MNIFIPHNIFENLSKSTLLTINFGSHMYGLEHNNSDIDTMYIYATSDFELNSFQNSHHQLQFKDDNTDFIFTNIHLFIRNMLNGDSTINFEIASSNDLIGTNLEFLYNMRKEFYNYPLMRSYLGMARRDIKRVDIDGNTEFEKNKKIAHAHRGFVFAKKVFQGDEITLDIEDIDFIRNEVWGFDYKQRLDYSKVLMQHIINLRREINTDLDDNKLIRYMRVEAQKKLDKYLIDFINSDNYNLVKSDDLGISKLLYNANENGIKY